MSDVTNGSVYGSGISVGAFASTLPTSPFECRLMYRFYMDNIIRIVGVSGFFLNFMTVCVLLQPGIGKNIKGKNKKLFFNF
jgi:hypothetical protein